MNAPFRGIARFTAFGLLPLLLIVGDVPLAEANAIPVPSLSSSQTTVCLTKKAAILKRSNQALGLASAIEIKFSDIASKATRYDTSGLLPENPKSYSLATLTAALPVKKTSLDSAVQIAQGNLRAFSCTGDAPDGGIGTFNGNMQVVSDSLQAYRDSIKALTQSLELRQPGLNTHQASQ